MSLAEQSSALSRYLGRPVAAVKLTDAYDDAHRLASALRLCGEAFDARPTLCVVDGEPSLWAVVVPAVEFRRAFRAASAITRGVPVDRAPARRPLARSRGEALHRWMAAVGVAQHGHYTEAALALGRDVASLGTLTPDEDARVRAAVAAARGEVAR